MEPEKPAETSSLAELSSTRVASKTCEDFLNELSDHRRDQISRFHNNYRTEIEASWGSQSKHQAWPGGYIDHLAETFRMAEVLYESLSRLHDLPFSRDSAIVVLYFHDVEKIWKYTTGLPKGFDKEQFLFGTLQEEFDIVFSPEEVNALKFIHGESATEYDPQKRLMGRLAAFCHSIDTMSARMWYDEGRGLG